MNNRPVLKASALAVAMSLGLAISANTLAEDVRYQSHLLENTLVIEPLDRSALDSAADLIVKGPGDYIERFRFSAGQPIEFGLRGLADGAYRYELQLTSMPVPAPSRDGSEAASAIPMGASGVFTIVNGRPADRGLIE